MYCKYCGALLDDDAVFCESCGKPVSGRSAASASASPAPEKTVSAPGEKTVSAAPVETVGAAPEERAIGAVPEETVSPAPEKSVSAPGEEIVGAASEEREIGAVPEGTVSPAPEKAVQKKGRTPPVIIAVVIIALIAAAGLIFSGKKTGQKASVPDVVSQCNFSNGALFAFDDSRIYFYSVPETGDGKNCLFSKAWDGSDEKILSTDETIKKIRISEGKLLYSTGDSDSQKYALKMMNPDGTEESLLVESDAAIDVFDRTGEDIFYLADKKLHASSSGGDGSVLLSDVEYFLCAGDVIYYTTEEGLFSYDRKKTESEKLIDRNVSEFCYDNDAGKIYYLSDDTVYEMGLKERTEKKIADVANGNSMIILDDTMYLIRVMEAEELLSLLKRNDMEEYVIEMVGGGYLVQVSLEDGHVDEMEPVFVGVALFAYPGDIYYRYSYFMNEMGSLKKVLTK